MRIIKIVFSLVISGALSACAVFLLREHLQYRGIVEDLSVWGSFFNVLGVIYAIVGT
jgi:hypothetical protein